MKEWIAYAVVSSVVKLAGALPRSLARALAEGLARILFALTPKLRKTAEFNLKLAFPRWTDAQREATIRGMVRSLGWMAAEFARMPRYTREHIEEIIVLDGHENFLEGQRRQQRRDRAWQAGGDFGWCAGAKELEEDRASPIEKRRFFEPRLSVKPRRNPIARFRHIARDPGIARLIGTDESNDSEMAEIANIKSDQDQNGPADALRGRRSDFAGRL